ncbi:ion channel [Polynucleobacter sinensis]|mgnify:CR=1 FL=1|jgi:hypothetical protein|uniref:ion channel n=1 Tax=Polynucleobacter sinensis TaxID=1743157 RepID=UPI0007829C10|nr:ion channel [Polynucleobacter sinensis]
MNFTILELPYLVLLYNIALGILGLIAILFFHGSAINHVLTRFKRLTKANLALAQYNRVFFHFYLAFVYIALIHIVEILMWAFFILRMDLIEKPVDAILFSGSCYTTVGFISDVLPDGWKSLAFFIAFTGLFCLAWTTSIMIGMTNTYQNAWDQKYHTGEGEI